MKRFLLLWMIVTLICTIPLSSQGQSSFWSDIEKSNPQRWTDRAEIPTSYRTLEVDLAGLSVSLSQAPLEQSAAAPLVLSLPMSDGTMQQFAIWESPIMEPGLAAKFPGIRNYIGKGVDDGTASLRISVSHKGFRCLIRSTEGMTLIEPASRLQVQPYLSYRAATLPNGASAQALCGTVADGLPAQQRSVPQAIGQELLTYRIAISSSANYTQWAGGTVADAIAEINSVISQINVAMERDLAIRLTLVSNNDQLVFLPGQTDPFTDDPNNAGNNLQANHDFITSTIGSGAFDIGHVFIRIPTQGGLFVAGIATLNAVCRSSRKGRGASTSPNPGNFGFVETTAHEIGHQFGASHTFNSVTGGCQGNRSNSSAYEPGSGSTIMSYSSCGTDNIIGGRGFYFHAVSLESIINYSRNAQGNLCPGTPSLNNQPPTVNAGNGGFFIPISTPFELTGVASDTNGDSLTYCWEQFDLGAAGGPNDPVGNAPIFRSFPPTENPTRIFPQITDILSDQQTRGELLPTYDRDLTFRLTVRDQNGGVTTDEMAFEVTEDAGPFEVLFPNAAGTYTAGYPMQVQWDVSNTDLAPVNCAQVDIFLSADGGFTFPYQVADNVPNTGSANITIPDVGAVFARIKVKAADNVFFDVSDNDFSIELPAAPGFALFPESDTLVLCGISDLTLPIYSASLLGFSDEIGLSVQGLPTGLTGGFVSDSLAPGDTAILLLSTTDTLAPGFYSIPILGFTASGPSDALIVQLQVANPVLPGQSIALAPGSSTGSAPNTTFSWMADPEATSYTLQVATNPGFGPGNLVANISGIMETSYTLSDPLVGETIHYWRVKAENPCGSGPYSQTKGFQTGVCTSDLSTDVPLNIPTFGTPATVTSILPAQVLGNVTSVKVVDLVGTHSAVSQLEMFLSSPTGTTVELFSGICSPSDQNFELNFSDAGEDIIPCPPVEDGIYRPTDSLSAFHGEFGFGVWTLTVRDLQDFDNGQVLSWGLEICRGGAPGPLLIENNPMTTTQWFQETISNSLLEVQDAGSNPDELIYTVVSLPEHGGILLNGTNLSLGGTFSQQDIDQSRLSYLNNGSASPVDSFRFDVINSGGGWIGVYTFEINVQAGATAIDDPLKEVRFVTYPNPTTAQVTVELEGNLGSFTLSLLDTQGKEVYREVASMQGQRWNTVLDLSHMTSGLYLLHVSSEVGILSSKVVLEK